MSAHTIRQLDDLIALGERRLVEVAASLEMLRRQRERFER